MTRFAVCFCYVLADSEFPTKGGVFQQWTSTYGALLSVLAEQVEGKSSWIPESSTDLISKQTFHCYQLNKQSIHRKNVPRFWLQYTGEEPKSTGQQPV